MPQIFYYGADRLTTSSSVALCNGQLPGELSPETLEKIRASERSVDQIVASDKTVYGINTGFGILANTKISPEDTAVLQHKILQSHSVGVGDPVPQEIAKLMLIAKVHASAQGFSGVRQSTIDRLLWHIGENVIPIVP